MCVCVCAWFLGRIVPWFLCCSPLKLVSFLFLPPPSPPLVFFPAPLPYTCRHLPACRRAVPAAAALWWSVPGSYSYSYFSETSGGRVGSSGFSSGSRPTSRNSALSGENAKIGAVGFCAANGYDWESGATLDRQHPRWKWIRNLAPGFSSRSVPWVFVLFAAGCRDPRMAALDRSTADMISVSQRAAIVAIKIAEYLPRLMNDPTWNFCLDSSELLVSSLSSGHVQLAASLREKKKIHENIYMWMSFWENPVYGNRAKHERHHGTRVVAKASRSGEQTPGSASNS